MNLSREDKKFLKSYNAETYEKPSVTVDGVILRLVSKQNENYRKLPEKKLQIFLNKRSSLPFKDAFAVVGTFVNLNNELTDTMKLCVKTKVGLQNYYYEQLYTFGEKSRDPRARVLSVGYLLLTNQNEHLENGEWFDIDYKEKVIKNTTNNSGYNITKEILITLSNENQSLENKILLDITKSNLEQTKSVTITESALAFDHAKIIFYALERLKNKLEYTDIIFNLLPKEFTLTELKQCYEVILNEKLLDANFRRKTAKMVSPTTNFITGKGHRSSQLFEHNPLWQVNDLD